MANITWFTLQDEDTKKVFRVRGITQIAKLVDRDYDYVNNRVDSYDTVSTKSGKTYRILYVDEDENAQCISGHKTDQLCIYCTKYVDGCVWSRSKARIPVPGWTAQEIYRDGILWSYHVTECPEFEEDPKCPRETKNVTIG